MYERVVKLDTIDLKSVVRNLFFGVDGMVEVSVMDSSYSGLIKDYVIPKKKYPNMKMGKLKWHKVSGRCIVEIGNKEYKVRVSDIKLLPTISVKSIVIDGRPMDPLPAFAIEDFILKNGSWDIKNKGKMEVFENLSDVFDTEFSVKK